MQEIGLALVERSQFLFEIRRPEINVHSARDPTGLKFSRRADIEHNNLFPGDQLLGLRCLDVRHFGRIRLGSQRFLPLQASQGKETRESNCQSDCHWTNLDVHNVSPGSHGSGRVTP